MDSSDTPKARRPLPTPGAPTPAPRPSTPVTVSSPVPTPTTTAYAQKPPPLPIRPKNPGSNLTTYAPPPRYDSAFTNHSPGFREPELVVDEPIVDDDEIPDLMPGTEGNTWEDNINSAYPSDVNNQWSTDGGYTAGWDHPPDITTWTKGSSTTLDYETIDYSRRIDNDYKIDGRDNREETLWWNREERERHKRPGPGFLPPLLADALHDPNHSLYCVNFATFPSQSKDQAPPGASAAPANSSSSQHSLSDSSAPSESETRKSVPHPNAYYCPKDNGWVILFWKSSSVSPPLAQSYIDGLNPPLPDQHRRRQTSSCIDDGEHPFGRTNRTHHFHKYEKAFDSHKLATPFRQDVWQSLESVKQKRRVGAILDNDIDINTINVDDSEAADGTEEQGKLLDLYVCCQCSFYCVASGVIPGVIPRKHIDELIRDKKAHPPVGKNGEQAIALAFETFLIALENKLWKGNNRMIKVMSTGFQSKVGWSPNVKRMFELLGFVEEIVDKDSTLKPPSTDLSFPTGKQGRRKLLRAWLEFSAWYADFKRVNAAHFKDWKDFKIHVQLDNAREMYQNAVGAHPDQIPRGSLSETTLSAMRSLKVEWHGLGLTPISFSPELLVFAYMAQCRCDPEKTPQYFTYLTEIVKRFQEFGDCPTELQELLVMEQSRDRFTLEDVKTAATTLGFGSDNVLHLDYDEDIPDDFVENAWKECIKRSWRDSEHGYETQKLATDSFRILAEYRGSVNLKRAWENDKNKYMNPNRAYDTLEVPNTVDDHMLITVYNMRVEETPIQLDKMREAMTVIAEVRDSDRLRQFISTGMDPGDIVPPTRQDFPRGLNQLGNTCYLNSLLQYFYTIKSLREAVLPMSKLDLKALDDEKLTDEELKRHRVGGRLVSRREVIRSRKFINQLADLFYKLEYSETAAVTPTIELAKLALVTSRDEEEEEIDKGGTESSNDTDATLVDDGPSRTGHLGSSVIPPSSPTNPKSSSVLGKRPRDLDRSKSAMEVDSPISQSPQDKDGFIVVTTRTRISPEPQEGSSKGLDRDGDVKMSESPRPKPPLPRKPTENDSTMMFGRQHDVAECMDNCMFQIETALLNFESMSESSDKTSVVKSLFYGKIRQRLTGANAQQSRTSTHEKEDLFSHLPVNVTNDGVDIYDGLSGYFDDIVEFEGRKARMEVTLVDLPPILQIQLQRVQFNRETLQPYKSQAYVKFGENLYMDRFLDTADPAKKARSKAIQWELTACRERVRLLAEGKDSPFATSLENTRTFLTRLQSASIPGIDAEVLRGMVDEKARIQAEIDQLRARIHELKEELEAIWSNSTEAAYELTSVFIHRGSSPSWGHYFFYSRHLPEAPDSWFKYNDSDVTVVSKEEVLADTTGDTANPYLLVFARKGADVVDTVNRFDASLLDTD